MEKLQNGIIITTPKDRNIFGKIKNSISDFRYKVFGAPQLIGNPSFIDSNGIRVMLNNYLSENHGWNGSKSRGALSTGISRYVNIYKNYIELRRQSRIAFLESNEARAIVKRSAELTISSGLKIEATPVWEIVAPNWDKEKKRKWVKNVEQSFKLYCESTESDITGRRNFYQMQYFLRLLRKVDGEYFAHLRYDDKDIRRMSPVQIQVFRPEQIRNPHKTSDIEAIEKRGNTCYMGIEMDQFGKPIAYYVYNEKGSDYVRIQKEDPISRRIFMIHGANLEDAGQVRGISSLAPHLHELSKLTGFKIAELQAALINATIAAWVEPSQNAPASNPMGGAVKRDQPQTPQTVNAPAQAELNDSGLFIGNLQAGEKLQSYDTKRPNVNFDGFYTTMLRALCAESGYAESVVSMRFNSNYTAARGEIIVTFNKIIMEREEEIVDLNNPIYTMWFQESVSKGEIEAPNFRIPKFRAAWTKADWTGLPQLDVNPTDTVEAATRKVEQGFSTREREAQNLNGSEFLENIEKLVEENKMLYEAKKYLIQESARGNEKLPMVDENQDDDEEESPSD